MTLLMVFSFFQGSAASGRTDTLPPIKISNFNFDKVDGFISNEREIRAGLLYDVERNKILWEKEMDSPAPIASLTKMMVCLLAIEDLNSGSICLDDRITVTRTYKKRLRRRRYTTYPGDEKY